VNAARLTWLNVFWSAWFLVWAFYLRWTTATLTWVWAVIIVGVPVLSRVVFWLEPFVRNRREGRL
jgi:hypothetical protein